MAAGTVESRSTLPSFLYLAAEHEAGQASYDLPWHAGNDYVVGQMARSRRLRCPTALSERPSPGCATAAWTGTKAILPWGAADEVNKVSPVTAAQRYLEHLVAAWGIRLPPCAHCQSASRVDRAGVVRRQCPAS